jgi:glycosyltransferase involved in cell wall biosynthesis
VPTVSAIVPNFNDAPSLERAIASLAAQTVPFHEIVVVDDGSTDESASVLERLGKSMPRLRVLRHSANQGVVAALNHGLQDASGEFVVLCSANDSYPPRLVEWCTDVLTRHPDVGAITGNAAVRDDRRADAGPDLVLPLPRRTTVLSPEALARAARRVPVLLNPGFAIRRTLAIEAGGLDPALRWHSDWFLFHLTAFASGYAFVPEAFSTIHVSGAPRYSGGMADWTLEGPCIRALVRRLAGRPAAAAAFRRAALLPRYDLRELWLLRDRDLRWFITPLLVWRMTVHSAAYWLHTRLPRRFLMWGRRWIRS